MKKKNLGSTLTFLGCTFIATYVHAEPSLDGFDNLDSNRDGTISWQEYAARNPISGRLNPRRIFDNVDKNRNGLIDRHEFTRMKERPSPRSFLR